MRAFANIADDLEAAGYSPADIARIRLKIDQAVKLREIIRKASGETIDLKAYEADMRHLIDTYIQADEPRKISPFDDMPLLALVVQSGIADAINQLPDGIKGDRSSVAETIENNVRSKIMRALYNNLQKLLPQSPTVGVWQQPASVGNVPYDHALELAMRVDAAIKTNRPDGWRGVLAREQIIRRAIFDAVQNFDLVEPIFLIIVQQGEY